MLSGLITPFDAWLAYGIHEGWVTEPICTSHGEIPARAYEEMEFEAGLEPCIYILRIWEDGKPEDEDTIVEPLIEERKGIHDDTIED